VGEEEEDLERSQEEAEGFNLNSLDFNPLNKHLIHSYNLNLPVSFLLLLSNSRSCNLSLRDSLLFNLYQ